MATNKQTKAARRNVTKAREAAASKRTIANMPKQTRTALGKQGRPSHSVSGPAAIHRRPGRNSTRSPGNATCPGVPRWDVTNWPASSAKSSRRPNTRGLSKPPPPG